MTCITRSCRNDSDRVFFGAFDGVTVIEFIEIPVTGFEDLDQFDLGSLEPQATDLQEPEGIGQENISIASRSP